MCTCTNIDHNRKHNRGHGDSIEEIDNHSHLFSKYKSTTPVDINFDKLMNRVANALTQLTCHTSNTCHTSTSDTSNTSTRHTHPHVMHRLVCWDLGEHLEDVRALRVDRGTAGDTRRGAVMVPEGGGSWWVGMVVVMSASRWVW